MSITFDERPNMATIGRDSATLYFVLNGASNRMEAHALAKGYTQVLFVGGLVRTDIHIHEVGPGLFYVEVTWGVPDKKEPTEGEWSWGFDTTGATKHITHGLADATRYTEQGAWQNGEWTPRADGDDDSIDHEMAIGVNDNGDVEGVDVPDRAYRWHETHQLLLADFGFTYATLLGGYTGRKNSATFRGFPAGTVRFDGAQGGKSSRDPEFTEFTYHFCVSPDEEDITIGTIKGISKPGWDYLWVRYEQSDDDVAKKTTPKPRQVDVNPVIKSFDFALLGIGTEPPTE